MIVVVIDNRTRQPTSLVFSASCASTPSKISAVLAVSGGGGWCRFHVIHSLQIDAGRDVIFSVSVFCMSVSTERKTND